MKKYWEDIKNEAFDPFKFNIVVNNYNVSKNIVVQRGCNSITITNIGAGNIFINGIVLFPSATPATVAGDSISFGGNLGEIYVGELNLLVTVGAAALVQVIQKFYTAFE